ncbi:MAG: hypothetical protein JNL88_10880 [Bacteroidia bacterium]|nr:hypothetical protein [Bacteroidia bacterium]
MRTLLVMLIFVHGGLHLLGFVKAFGFSEVKQLAQPISKRRGMLWLIAALLFLTAATIFALRQSYWWWPAGLALLLSQLLIFSSWQDARYGTLANLLILVASIVSYASCSFHKSFQNEVAAALQQKEEPASSLLLESDLQHLPVAVKKYLHYTGAVGQAKVRNFKIEFSGNIRKNEESAWMPFRSRQYNVMHPPARLFFMKAEMFHLPVSGFHSFKSGKAFMDIRLLSLFRVQYMEGAEMDKSETITFFNDMCCMAPATLIDPGISWEAVNDTFVRAVFSMQGHSIRADLYFNREGALVNFISPDRYSADAGRVLPWATPLKEYRNINGHRLAGAADAVYVYPDRKLVYGTFNTVSVHYNLP